MMDNIREKLVKLLDEAENQYLEAVSGAESSEERYAIVKGAYGFYADYLLANNVTVQERGEWQREEQSPSGVFWFECSECHTKWGYGAVLHMKYCPNCGAKMKPLLPPKGE